MGKRKSKTSKKKHAQAVSATSTSARNSRKHRTALSSSTFGVPVTRGGQSPSEPKRRTTATARNPSAGRRRRRDGAAPLPVVRDDRERREFEEECAALSERERYSKGGALSSGKGKGKKGKGKGKGKDTERGLAFAPSTLPFLNVGDGRVRSLDDMVVETTSRLSSGSINIGGGGTLLPQQKVSDGSNMLQLMASKIRRDERIRKLAQTTTGKEEAAQNTPNRYWALEEEEEKKEDNEMAAKFSFAPASFALSSSYAGDTACVSGAATVFGGVEEDDPDL